MVTTRASGDGEEDEGAANRALFVAAEAENTQAGRLTAHAQIKDVTSCE